jgi:hypothetical protein
VELCYEKPLSSLSTVWVQAKIGQQALLESPYQIQTAALKNKNGQLLLLHNPHHNHT